MKNLLVIWEIKAKVVGKAKDVDNVKGKLSDVENRNSKIDFH